MIGIAETDFDGDDGNNLRSDYKQDKKVRIMIVARLEVMRMIKYFDEKILSMI